MRTQVEERMPFPWQVKEPLLKETGSMCAHCGIQLDRYSNLSVDHIIPLSKGGSNDPSNLTVLCDDCNGLKSDMILHPVEWYPYLPEKRRKKLLSDMIRYIEETDYLSENCLMPMDKFRLRSYIRSNSKCNRRNDYNIPITIEGSRMTRDDAFAWLMDYKRSLQWRDTLVMLQSPSEFPAPCYLLKKGDIEVAMVNPHIYHEWIEEEKAYANTVLIDWFFSSEMPKKDTIPDMLAYMMDAMDSYIGIAMSSTMKGASLVLMKHRCFVSDRFCEPVFNKLKAMGRQIVTDEYKTTATVTGRIKSACTWGVLGNRKEAKNISAELAKKAKEGITKQDIAHFSAAMNRRLDGDT